MTRLELGTLGASIRKEKKEKKRKKEPARAESAPRHPPPSRTTAQSSTQIRNHVTRKDGSFSGHMFADLCVDDCAVALPPAAAISGSRADGCYAAQSMFSPLSLRSLGEHNMFR